MDNTQLAVVLKKASPDVLQEILREAEARLEAQLTAAVAADQRAMTFLGFILTLVAFLIGASLAAVTASVPNQAISNIAWFGAVGLSIAGVFAYLATRPIKFELVGNDPESWAEDIEAASKAAEGAASLLGQALPEQVAFYNEMLGNNRKAMTWSSRWLFTASIIAGVTLLLCGLAAAPAVWSWSFLSPATP